MSFLRFPDEFIWGTSTSAYQIEGGYDSDGKGESIWDRYTHTSGRIYDGTNGDIACDHYHRFEQDIRFMKEMGVKAYRFSISWPRIFPKGFGKPNAKGIKFYSRLIDLLISNDIMPTATLYHWDLPQKLQELGGWENRSVAEYFEQYARYVFSMLGDRVPYWLTFNEPFVSSFIGYWYGGHPPGIRNATSAILAAHHTLLAHGLTVKAFREMGMKGEIGIALNLNSIYPGTEEEKDFLAAERYADFQNGWFLDPILKGKYPEKLVNWLKDKISMPEFNEKDMEIISTPIDFLGVNYYSSNSIIDSPNDLPLQTTFVNTGKPRTASGWEIYPEGLYDLLLYLHEEYDGIKIIITENGACFKDELNPEGEINDDDRIAYLKEHISQAHRALEAGVNLEGYFVWSFLDNFEWNMGYSHRFGLVYVDYDNLNRIFKKSGVWYSGVINFNGLSE